MNLDDERSDLLATVSIEGLRQLYLCTGAG